MVHVNLIRVDDRIGLVIKGHADYVKRGDDIVCSAVSSLGQNVVNGCKTYGTNTEVKQLREGYISFTTDFNQMTMALVYTTYNSLKEIAKEYPQCFKPIVDRT